MDERISYYEYDGILIQRCTIALDDHDLMAVTPDTVQLRRHDDYGPTEGTVEHPRHYAAARAIVLRDLREQVERMQEKVRLFERGETEAQLSREYRALFQGSGGNRQSPIEIRQS